MKKNIIFDWSGTISDDLESVHRIINLIFHEKGVKQLSFEEFRDDFELPYMNFWRRHTAMSQEEVEKTFTGYFRTHWNPKPLKHASRILAYLHNQGAQMAVLSSLDNVQLKEEARLYGFQDYFIDVVSAHDKISEIKLMLKKHSFKTTETAFVGDMAHDIDAGRSAGVTTVGVLTGYEPKKLIAAKPDFIIKDMSELPNVI